MKDYNFDQNSNDFSEEYRSEKEKSDQYAKAARQASSANQDSTDYEQGYRSVRFEQGDHADQKDEVLARERAFRDSIESTGYRDDRYYQDQKPLDLDELDSELDQTGPLQSDSRMKHSARSEQLKPRRTARPVRRRSPKTGPSPLRDIFSGLQQALFLTMSKRPMQVFHLNLHWGSLGILALLNILLVAGLNTIVYSKVLGPILSGLGTLVKGAKSTGVARVLGISALSQLTTLLVIILIIFVLTIILNSERKNLKQFVQTATLSTLPYSFILLIALLVSIFLPQVGIILALTGKIHAYIYLYAGFQKGHPTKKNSPFWFFILLIAVVLVVQYLFLAWAI